MNTHVAGQSPGFEADRHADIKSVPRETIPSLDITTSSVQSLNNTLTSQVIHLALPLVLEIEN